MPSAVAVLLNAIYSFLFLFLVAKMLGKKQIAELDFIDYVVGISIGSIAAEWSTDVVNPWYYYVIGMSVFFVFSLSITYLERTALWIKKILRGRPIIIIEQGKVNFSNLCKSKLDMNDVLGMCRSKGYFDISTIEYAIFETNGELSILPTTHDRPVVFGDISKNDSEEAVLTKYLIVDGVLDKSYLKELGKNSMWVLKKLDIRKCDLKKIIIATYDIDQDIITVHYK